MGVNFSKVCVSSAIIWNALYDIPDNNSVSQVNVSWNYKKKWNSSN